MTIPRLFVGTTACLTMLLLTFGCSSLFEPKTPSSYIDPVTGMEFVLVKGDCFQMGDARGDIDKNARPVHEVCLDDYYLAKTEVTQGQWLKIMSDNPSHFPKGNNHPVERVSWDDSQEFLSALSKKSGKKYRLPTEAEWEFACRSGGKDELFCGGNDPKDYAWFDRTGGGSTQPVATRAPNALGLYDMSGNVWEFCSDIYAAGYYATSPVNNPAGAGEGPHIIKRGGSWSINPRYLRATVRGRANRSDKHYSTGFRVALSTP